MLITYLCPICDEINVGQTVMGCGGTVDYLVNAVFNYPTLAESYTVAALDAMNKMRHIAWLGE
jgi:NAD(P) transhydrogenase